MARILCVSTPKVKRHRRSPRPVAPFGSGILAYTPYAGRIEHSRDDESWYAAQARYTEPEMPDAEYDLMAAISEWEARYESAAVGSDRCSLCGLVTRELCGGLCDTCATALDADFSIDGGVCGACARIVDFLEDTGLCLPCDLHASAMSNGSSGGY